MRGSALRGSVAAIMFTIAAVTMAPVGQAADKDAWFTAAVKTVEARIEPPAAKPGQTVTFQLIVELNEGYHTYPVKQPDENAANFTNRLSFPAPETLIFVGETRDPAKFQAKPEPDLMILELRTLTGRVVYERPAVVSPRATPGEVTVTVKDFRLNVCDASNCFPAKKLTPSAKFQVLPGPAVPVAAEFADEVKKALGN